LFCDYAVFVRLIVFLQVQHAMLVMKQLVLLHGIPSDVKVSSVIDETVNKEPQNDHMFETKQFSWKGKNASESSREARRPTDFVGAQGSQVSQINSYYCVQCAFRLR
jgi:hypothetical protein